MVNFCLISIIISIVLDSFFLLIASVFSDIRNILIEEYRYTKFDMINGNIFVKQLKLESFDTSPNVIKAFTEFFVAVSCCS